MPPAVDLQRSVAATFIEWATPPLEHIPGQGWYGPPGAMIAANNLPERLQHRICCPGCGKIIAGKPGAKWTYDPVTITANPSLAQGCCGWHGYLKNGVFSPC